MTKGKKLNADNWNLLDARSSYIQFVSSADGGQYCLTGAGWVDLFLSNTLTEDVPAELQDLYEVALSTMCYGFNYYPLYTAGLQQMTRVLEAAISHAFIELNGPSSKSRYQEKLNWVALQLEIPEDRKGQWEAGRKMRNSASHATKQSLFGPNDALGFARVSSDLINELFQIVRKYSS